MIEIGRSSRPATCRKTPRGTRCRRHCFITIILISTNCISPNLCDDRLWLFEMQNFKYIPDQIISSVNLLTLAIIRRIRCCLAERLTNDWSDWAMLVSVGYWRDASCASSDISQVFDPSIMESYLRWKRLFRYIAQKDTQSLDCGDPFRIRIVRSLLSLCIWKLSDVLRVKSQVRWWSIPLFLAFFDTLVLARAASVCLFVFETVQWKRSKNRIHLVKLPIDFLIHRIP